MNILYLHQYFNTPAMPGSTRSYEFARRLVSRGDTVHMITSNWQGWAPRKFSVEKGISVYWLPVSYANRMSITQRVFIFIKYIWYTLKVGSKLKYDLVVASSTPLTIALPALWLKYKKKVPLVFEIRDLWPQLPIAVGAIKFPPLIWLANKLEKRVYQASQQVVVLSKGMHAELLKNGLPNKKLSPELLNRPVNDGFSGGEKKRNEIFQMAVLEPKLAILDETDSGLDIDALKIVANGVNALRSSDRSTVVVTHYQRMLNYIVPDFVHVLSGGRIVKSGGKELALELEEKGYGWIDSAPEEVKA